MNRSFYITAQLFIDDGRMAHGDLGVQTNDGSFISKNQIFKCFVHTWYEKGYTLTSINILSVFEFKSEKDFVNFLGNITEENSIKKNDKLIIQ